MSPQVTPPAVALAGVSKAFGATRAVSDVSFTVRAGTVHALLGENGAGKSTTMKLLSGLIEPDEGTIAIDGREVRLRSPRDAHRAGIRTAFQELTLVRDLSVLDNMLIPAAPMSFLGTLRRKQVAENVAAHFARLGLAVDLHAEVGRLDLALRQKIEIARALYRQPRLLLLDEPTSALAGSDVEWLGALIADAKARGITVLFISHRMPEVRAFCDDMTVLRNGKRVASGAVADFTDAQVVEMIIGRSLDQTFPPRRAVPVADRPAPVLETRGLAAGAKLSDVDLVLRPGEILGVAALEGQGQRGLFRLLAGLETPAGGVIRVDGKVAAYHSPRAALRCGSGISYLPEERKTEGFLAGLSAATNVVLPLLSRVGRAGFIGRRDEERAAQPSADQVALNPRYLGFAIGDLSGGNQQKALMARTLATGARTLLLFDPTRGVDVGTKESIYAAIRAFAERGGSVLFYSSELPEIVQLADRCLVLYGGQVFRELQGDDIAEQTLVAAMIGHDPHGPAGRAPAPFATPAHAVAENAR